MSVASSSGSGKRIEEAHGGGEECQQFSNKKCDLQHCAAVKAAGSVSWYSLSSRSRVYVMPVVPHPSSLGAHKMLYRFRSNLQT